MNEVTSLPENRDQLEIKLILGNKKLKERYEDCLLVELEIRKLNARLEKTSMKPLDKDEEKNNDEAEEEFDV